LKNTAFILIAKYQTAESVFKPDVNGKMTTKKSIMILLATANKHINFVLVLICVPSVFFCPGLAFLLFHSHFFFFFKTEFQFRLSNKTKAL
jgi:hypothetical protein